MANFNPETLKSGGLIPERKGTVTVRCMAPGGILTAARLKKIADVAEKYGSGEVHLSVRMSPEILHVKLENVDQLAQELAEVGQRIASCGKRVRVPTACGGCEYNPNGLVDSQRLAREFNDRYFGQEHHHKFKISFSGCPIDCLRAREMDMGFQGQVIPRVAEETCSGCGVCVSVCAEEALVLVDGLPQITAERCTACGACIKSCPFDAMVAAQTGLAVYVGGKHGKHPHVAYPVAEFIPEDQAFAVAEVVMAWYREHGQPGERIGVTIDRVGIDRLRQALIPVVGDRLLQQEDLRQHRWRSLFWAGVMEAFPTYGKL